MGKIRADHVGEQRTAYEKNKRRILQTQTICGICGKPVEKNKYKYPHPLSAVVDHIIPIDKGGHPCDIENLQLAHRTCNTQKSNKFIDIKQRFPEQEEIGIQLPLHYNWSEYKAVSI